MAHKTHMHDTKKQFNQCDFIWFCSADHVYLAAFFWKKLLFMTYWPNIIERKTLQTLCHPNRLLCLQGEDLWKILKSAPLGQKKQSRQD